MKEIQRSSMTLTKFPIQIQILNDWNSIIFLYAYVIF